MFWAVLGVFLNFGQISAQLQNLSHPAMTHDDRSLREKISIGQRIVFRLNFCVAFASRMTNRSVKRRDGRLVRGGVCGVCVCVRACGCLCAPVLCTWCAKRAAPAAQPRDKYSLRALC